MDERHDELHDLLLREWHVQHELVHFYSTSLIRLLPGDPDAARRRRDLCAKLSIATLALTHASDQLQAYERERELAAALRR